ncbi:MAG TPA: acetyl-CoA hydrolase, partial [Massilibacterium sp.]|nr:acetyl-CoA hydrolase [Massilibacterium sp.]
MLEQTIKNRIKNDKLVDKVVKATEAISWIEDGMTLGLSGFTRAGEPKSIPLALIERSKTEKFKVNVFTG